MAPPIAPSTKLRAAILHAMAIGSFLQAYQVYRKVYEREGAWKTNTRLVYITVMSLSGLLTLGGLISQDPEVGLDDPMFGGALAVFLTSVSMLYRWRLPNRWVIWPGMWLAECTKLVGTLAAGLIPTTLARGAWGWLVVEVVYVVAAVLVWRGKRWAGWPFVLVLAFPLGFVAWLVKTAPGGASWAEFFAQGLSVATVFRLLVNLVLAGLGVYICIPFAVETARWVLKIDLKKNRRLARDRALEALIALSHLDESWTALRGELALEDWDAVANLHLRLDVGREAFTAPELEAMGQFEANLEELLSALSPAELEAATGQPPHPWRQLRDAARECLLAF